MKIVVLYVCVTQGGITRDLAARFVGTYQAFPPEAEHSLLVVCNGGPPATDIGLVFLGLDPQFYPRENDASWDIGAYQAGARGPAADADILVCLGESVYFHRAGWLRRVVEAWTKYGAGMYGFFSSNLVRPHMNTTGFATSPVLLRDYPKSITTHHDRYEFEHGERAFWRYVHGRGMPTKLLTWDGEWDPFLWRYPANILWRGDQSNCLVLCNHTERYDLAPPDTRRVWARGADSPPMQGFA